MTLNYRFWGCDTSELQACDTSPSLCSIGIKPRPYECWQALYQLGYIQPLIECSENSLYTTLYVCLDKHGYMTVHMSLPLDGFKYVKEGTAAMLFVFYLDSSCVSLPRGLESQACTPHSVITTLLHVIPCHTAFPDSSYSQCWLNHYYPRPLENFSSQQSVTF